MKHKWGNYLAKIRRSKKLRQQDIADMVGLTRSSVANFESGRQDLTISKFLKYVEALDLVLVPVPKELVELSADVA